MAGEPFTGEIRLFGFNFAPRNWALAQGQTMAVNQNQALFSLYGVTYGGNGSSTFNLPDLRGRIPIGQGQRQGGSTYTMGQAVGTEQTTLQVTNLPAHNHSFTGTLNAVQTKATAQGPTAGAMLARSNDENGTDNPLIYVPSGTTGDQVGLAGVAGTTGATGGNQPVATLPPVLGLNYSVALLGIYPTRN